MGNWEFVASFFLLTVVILQCDVDGSAAVRGGTDAADFVGRRAWHLWQLSHADGEATDVLPPTGGRTTSESDWQQHADDVEPSEGCDDCSYQQGKCCNMYLSALFYVHIEATVITDWQWHTLQLTDKQRHSVNLLPTQANIWMWNDVNIHDIGTVWNNAFRHIFNCCWHESVKPLQYFCQSLPWSYLSDERRLMFFRKLLVHDNIVIRTLVALPAVYYE